MTAAELKAVKFKDTPEQMMTLGELCALVDGRVPIVIELKSHFDGDRKLARRMAEVLSGLFRPRGGDVVRSRPDPGAARSHADSFRAASLPNAIIPRPTGRRPRRPSAAA